MKRRLKKIIPRPIWKVMNAFKRAFTGGYSVKSYAQEGEDRILDRIFEGKSTGFYVDVGAHHPERFSNTRLFYGKGWNGINIDAMPESMRPFNRRRKKDINLEAAISDKEEELTYYAFDEPALNGFSEELVHSGKRGNHKVIFTKKIKTTTLENIFKKYLPLDTYIDFLTVDAEGLDFKVLKSNNWDKYRPKVVITESLNFSFETHTEDPCFKLLSSKGYILFAKTVNSLIFKLR